MKLPYILFIIILSAGTAFAVAQYAGPQSVAPAQAIKETAYERLMRTETLRCGYIFWPQFFEKNPNTGAYSGAYYKNYRRDGQAAQSENRMDGRDWYVPQILEQVMTGKADMAMTEASTAAEFLKKNPGQLKQLKTPVRVLSGGITLPVKEDALKDMVDTTIETMHTSGFNERTFNKYADAPGVYLFPAQAWQFPKTQSQ